MTEQYLQEEINLVGSGSGGGGHVFVFRPGAVPTSSNVFDTWVGALEAAQSVDGISVLQVDDSIQSPATVPFGVHDVSGVTLIGTVANFNLTGVLTLLEIDDGGVLDGLFEVSNVLEIVSNSLSPVVEAPAGALQTILLLNRGSTIRSATGVPFYNVSAAGVLTPVLNLGGSLSTDAISIDGGVVAVICQDLANVQFDAVVGGAGALFFQILGKGIGVDTVQAGFAGFVGGNFDSAGGDIALFSAGSLATPGVSFLFPGGTNPAGASVADVAPQGFQMMRDGFLGGASVVHQVPGAPNPITYDLLVNGIPSFTIPSDASAPTTLASSGAFTRLFIGDIITVVATTAGVPTPTGIRLAMQIV